MIRKKRQRKMTVELSRSRTSDPVVQPESWSQILDEYYASLYHMDIGLREAATIAASVMVTRTIPGDPLWLYVVGPPSTGKTVIVDSLSTDEEHCIAVSKLTSKTLISGWKDPEDPDKDVSIFGILKERALLIKDFTAVMTMSGGIQEELYGMLRDCYDGHVKVIYGNGKVVEYKGVYFPLIAAVTDVIKGDNRAHLGERFLRCEVLGPGHDDEATIMAAMDSTVRDSSRDEKLSLLGRAITFHLNSVARGMDLTRQPPMEPEVVDNLIALSRVVGSIRTVVDEDGDHANYRPRAEGGARVAKQLKKLGMALTYLLGRDKICGELYPLIRKVGLDTVNGYPLEILQTLSRKNRGMLTTDDLVDRFRMPKTNMVRHLLRLRSINALASEAVANPFSRGGRRRHTWTLTTPFRELWDRARLNPEARTAVV